MFDIYFSTAFSIVHFVNKALSLLLPQFYFNLSMIMKFAKGAVKASEKKHEYTTPKLELPVILVLPLTFNLTTLLCTNYLLIDIYFSTAFNIVHYELKT